MSTQSVFSGSGQLSTDKMFAAIPLRPQSALATVNVNEALRINMPVSTLNAKFADTWNDELDKYGTNAIDFTLAEIRTAAAVAGAITLTADCALHGAYVAFHDYVISTYFGEASEELFDEESIADMVTVDATEVLELINAESAEMTLSLELNDITELLRRANDAGLGTRDPANGTASGGFMAGEFVHFPVVGVVGGFHVEMKVEFSGMANSVDPSFSKDKTATVAAYSMPLAVPLCLVLV
jgi:hypothetical protein